MKEIRPIARFRSPLTAKFGIPRQSGLVPDLPGTVALEPGFASPDALRGLEDFDYLWLIWNFSANPAREAFSATVRPPRLGGNERLGVFATRSPFRPNGLGLSCVRIAAVRPERGEIDVLGADLMDGTPIYDIKPYVAYCDSHPGARSGFVDAAAWKELEVIIPEGVDLGDISRETLIALLRQDPRPAYSEDNPSRVYGMRYGCADVRFTVAGGVLTVVEIVR